MSKPLQKRLQEELRTTDVDQVDAIVEVVFNWMQDQERIGNLSLASYWRDRCLQLIKDENLLHGIK